MKWRKQQWTGSEGVRTAEGDETRGPASAKCSEIHIQFTENTIPLQVLKTHTRNGLYHFQMTTHKRNIPPASLGP
jgi:hypothetical protein